MSIWFTKTNLDQLQKSSENTMTAYLDIQYTEIGDDYIKATMPVGPKTVQPMRLLHGGASVVLAETLGSIASWLACDPSEINGAVGIEINANHIKSAKEGDIVTGIVKPIKVGKTIHVWEINIYDSSEQLCCVSRLTTMILNKNVV